MSNDFEVPSHGEGRLALRLKLHAILVRLPASEMVWYAFRRSSDKGKRKDRVTARLSQGLNGKAEICSRRQT